MKFCMSTMCIDSSSIEEKISAIANAGFDSIELWTKDISDSARVAKLLSDAGIRPAQTTKIEGWLELDGSLMGVEDNESAILDECKRRFELTAALGCKYITAFPSRNDRGKFRPLLEGVDTYRKILDIGMGFGVCPAIEFIGQSSQIKDVDSVMEFIRLVDDDYAKIIVDAFHIWRAGDEMESFIKIPSDKIGLLHISDASQEYNKSEYKDRHRVMPGDGVIDLAKFISIAISKKFEGDISLGVYNRENWNRPAIDVAKEGYSKMKKVIGGANEKSL